MKKLTKRQLEILTLIGMGLTNTEIAKKLFITNHTVKAHLSCLYEKFGCNSKVQLTVSALKQRIIGLDEI